MSEPVDRQHYTTFVMELLQEERGEVRRTRLVDVRTGFEDTRPDWDEERLLNSWSPVPASDSEPPSRAAASGRCAEAFSMRCSR
jgi:hypothetical protein